MPCTGALRPYIYSTAQAVNRNHPGVEKSARHVEKKFMTPRNCEVILICIGIVFLLSTPAMAISATWTYSEPGTTIGGISVSSNGDSVAVAAGKIWLLSGKGSLLDKEPFGDNVVFTPDGTTLISSYANTIYQFKRIKTPNATQSPLEKLWDASLPATIRSIDVSNDGKTIVTSLDSSGTYVYSSTGQMVGGSKRYSSLIRVSSNGGRIVGVSQGFLCIFSRTGTGACSKSEDDVVGSTPDEMILTTTGNIAVFNDDQNVRSVFVNNKTVRWTQRATGDVTSIAMTPSGSKIFVGTENGHVDLFDERGNLSRIYPAVSGDNQSVKKINCVSTSKDGSVTAAGSSDGKIFALNSLGKEIWTNQTHDNVKHIAVSDDGSLVVATGDHTVYAFSKTPVSTSRPQIVPAATLSDILTDSGPDITPIDLPVEEIATIPPDSAAPTPYSVIHTSEKSPSSLSITFIVLLMVILIRPGKSE
jgi:hypothetical protein